MALAFASHIQSALAELRYHRSPKRIRALVDGDVVVDSTRALVVWEPRRVVPSYAVPVEDIAAALKTVDAPPAEERPVSMDGETRVLDPSTPFTAHTSPGEPATIVASRELPAAAFRSGDPDLAGYAVLDFDAFDRWLEEDEILLGHARDPFTRIDTRRSSRHVTVAVAGTTVADTVHPTLLFETYLPVRYYLPRADVRMDLLERSTATSVCAYKGIASYWNVRVGGTIVADIAWSYPDPQHDALAVRDMICFFNERVDLTVDGVAVSRPVTPWS